MHEKHAESAEYGSKSAVFDAFWLRCRRSVASITLYYNLNYLFDG